MVFMGRSRKETCEPDHDLRCRSELAVVLVARIEEAVRIQRQRLNFLKSSSVRAHNPTQIEEAMRSLHDLEGLLKPSTYERPRDWYAALKAAYDPALSGDPVPCWACGERDPDPHGTFCAAQFEASKEPT